MKWANWGFVYPKPMLRTQTLFTANLKLNVQTLHSLKRTILLYIKCNIQLSNGRAVYSAVSRNSEFSQLLRPSSINNRYGSASQQFLLFHISYINCRFRKDKVISSHFSSKLSDWFTDLFPKFLHNRIIPNLYPIWIIGTGI